MGDTRNESSCIESRIGNEQIFKGPTIEEDKLKRERVKKLLEDFRTQPPKVSIERARLLTMSFKETEDLPLELRWAKAMEKILKEISISIDDNELIVGNCGEKGRHGILFPELRGGWLAKGLEELNHKDENQFIISEQDIRVVKDEILPYWKGRTAHDAFLNMLPEDTRNIVFGDDDYGTLGLIQDNANINASLNWVCDYQKVLQKGFLGIKEEAEERLIATGPDDPNNNIDKTFFLKAVIIVCDAMVEFAKRYAKLAADMADVEKDPVRKKELEQISRICEWVPGKPARTFYEAIQAQWFTQLALRMEQPVAGVIGNGRIDQYLYPYYKRDMEEGIIDEDKALELLECLWIKIAQFLPINATRAKSFWQGYAHFEQTVIGGQTQDGRDATNDLSYLILRSKKEFPINYPDLSVRIHSQTPEDFLYKVCEVIKEGSGFPKLLNDETIIPFLLSQGALLEEARDYTGSGCTEVRMINRDTYLPLGASINLPAALEMALNNGEVVLKGKRIQLGIKTREAREFKDFDELMNALSIQYDYLVKHFYNRQSILEIVNEQKLSAVITSLLHDVCMRECQSIHKGNIKGARHQDTGNINIIGFGTVVESLTAIKKLIFDDKTLTMDELLQSLKVNFEGKEVIRQMLLNAPKYGNNDDYADNIAREVDAMLLTSPRKYKTVKGTSLNVKYVPVTAHVGLGAIMGATPNGRKAGEAFSEGISPSQGMDVNGPISTLISIAKSNSQKFNNSQARLLNIKLSPRIVDDEKGIKDLMSFIRAWCDQKHWHLQFNIVNSDMLRDAQKHPEKHKDLIVRVAGYSAFFVDLSPALQNEIISRTEHQVM
ncbi:MAG: pyruvate formate lyase family protein [Bacillota bacterium]